jgi:hypothetical protein|tara:strand:+ start:1145 stop:1363 length:219 start_codon:yes stop_codon:yes gene_type:complete
MPYEWMLILVTAVAPTEYNVAALSPFESLDECYQQSVYIDADIQRADNQEMMCIKLDPAKLSYAQPNVLRGW